MKKRFGVTLKGGNIQDLKQILKNLCEHYRGDAHISYSSGSFYFETREQREAFIEEIDPEWTFAFIRSVMTGS